MTWDDEKWILGSFLALLLVYGCVSQNPASQTNQTTNALDHEFQICNNLTTKPDFLGTNDNPRDRCIFLLALSRNNVTICNSILITGLFDKYSRAACGFDLAILKNDSSICDRLLTYNDSADCYIGYASVKNDSKICDRISNADLRDFCLVQYYEFHRDFICEEISNIPEKNVCFLDKGQTDKNLSACEKIVGYYYNQTSKSDYFNPKGECYAAVGFATNDLTACERLVEDFDKDQCYEYLAFSTHSIEYCDRILDSILRQGCVNAVISSGSVQ